MSEAKLIATEHARRAALVRDDDLAIADMLASHFHYAHINGLVEDRETYLARIAARAVDTIATSAHDIQVTMRPGYALMTGRSIMEYSWNDGSAAGRVETLFLSVWEPHANGWKISAYASTPLPETHS